MNTIQEFYISHQDGELMIDLPENATIISAYHDRVENRFVVSFVGDTNAPIKAQYVRLMHTGDIVPPNSRFVTTVVAPVHNKALDVFHLFQVNVDGHEW